MLSLRYLFLLILSSSAVIAAKEYYVSPSGNDTLNNGTESSPFKTIQTAAALMSAGDMCFIGEGIYRETISPAHSGTAESPIIFTAKKGEDVIITGCDTVTGWTRSSGDVYSAAAENEITQLFVDGVPANEARFPNSGSDLFSPATIDLNMSETEVTSSALTQPEGFFDGGKVWAMIGLRWVAQSADIISSSAGHLTIDNNSYADNTGAGIGFITGIFNALDTAGEWFWKEKKLYYQCPPEKEPSQFHFEGKIRKWVIDLSSRKYITLRGLKTRAGAVNMNLADYCCIDSMNMQYLSHFTAAAQSWTRHEYTNINSEGVGVGIFGSYDTVKNCEISWSAGDGVTLFGENNRVQNCIIHDCNYSGIDCNPISSLGTGHVITRNTVYNGGRGLIFLMKAQRNTVTYNHCYNTGLRNWDVGCIYTWGTDGNGTVIAYNWVHDGRSGGIDYHAGNGIYIDNYCANITVHHNVIWNCDYNAFNYSRPEKNIYFYNNTAFNA